MILIPFCSPRTLEPGVLLCRCGEWDWICTRVESHHSTDMAGIREHHVVKFTDAVLPAVCFRELTASPVVRAFQLCWTTPFGVCQLQNSVLQRLDMTYQIGDVVVVPCMEFVAYGSHCDGNSVFQYLPTPSLQL